jgi:hypothetical protein
MFIYNSDNTITIKCDDGEFRTYALNDTEFKAYMRTGNFNYHNFVEIGNEC